MRGRGRLWLGVLLVVGVAALLLAHGVLLTTVASGARLPGLVAAGLLLLVVVKHTGMVGALVAWWRGRRTRLPE